MDMNTFFTQLKVTLGEVAKVIGVSLPDPAYNALEIKRITTVTDGDEGDLIYMNHNKYIESLRSSRATACIISSRYAHYLNPHTIPLIVDHPYYSYAKALAYCYEAALKPQSIYESPGKISPHVQIDSTARLESNVTINPYTTIGKHAEIGAHTIIGANVTIGENVKIGRSCSIGSNTSISHALIGDEVIVHPGSRIGQDGFGYASTREGHDKICHIGRVIIQNLVEIGANSTIDRGSIQDTIIGEGTKIDNLVHIGHNVVVGRHCLIVSGTGISGSAILEDFVVLGGKVGVVGHIRIGQHAQIAGSSNVNRNVPAHSVWGGTPVRPIKDWFREIVTLSKLAKK